MIASISRALGLFAFFLMAFPASLKAAEAAPASPRQPVPQASGPGAIEVELTYAPEAFAGPFSGRVHLLWMNPGATGLPRMPNWGSPSPHHYVEVKNWKAGEPLKIGPTAKGYPSELGSLPKGGKRALFAVMDRDLGGISFAASEGNVWGRGPAEEWDASKGFVAKVRLDKVYKQPEFSESERMKLVRIRSTLLSDFHKKDQYLQAAVVVPETFDPKRAEAYPVLFEIPGFGGDHNGARKFLGKNGTNFGGVDFVCVMLDPNCRLGHHSFANSANNGPVGDALVEELIPAIETRFRCGGQKHRRLLTGHSSGGWSSMWLMTSYPAIFGGTWSTAPDPTDFHDFQLVDLYAPGNNIFRDAKGAARPLGRGGFANVPYELFWKMELPMKRGGQLQTFQAVFGPKGPDGFPIPLWNDDGAIDPVVFQSWLAFDIVAKIKREWPKKGADLKGRINMYCGTLDTFLLDGAAVLMKKALAELDPTATVEMIEGRDHGSVVDAALRARIRQEMADTVQGNRPKP